MHRYKTLTTRLYIEGVREAKWPPFRRRLWQRDYYEHIIRGASALQRIRNYIERNPLRWRTDAHNPVWRESGRQASGICVELTAAGAGLLEVVSTTVAIESSEGGACTPRIRTIEAGSGGPPRFQGSRVPFLKMRIAK